ncbi:MAG: hypothetical protein D6679_04220 [Candidatus Hydrogenedentota bacterium]|nr:MAG: hypothetical protein D6679_04220 [Candidatus Hydrogenedentota bacterium]
MSNGLGISAFVSYLDFGSQDRTTLSTAGGITNINNAGSFSAADVAGGVAFGRHFFNDNFSAGVSLKGIYSKLDGVTASAFAADLGAEYKLTFGDQPVTLGATAQNLGTTLKFDRVSEELPRTFQIGASTKLWSDRLTLYAGVEKVIHDDFVFRGGVEASPFVPMLTFRAGYDGSNDAGNGLTAGIGIKINNIVLDYAYIPNDVFSDNHRVGLQYHF